MNQVVSFERMVYYAYIQEQQEDPELVLHKAIKKPEKPDIAFGTRNQSRSSMNTLLVKSHISKN